MKYKLYKNIFRAFKSSIYKIPLHYAYIMHTTLGFSCVSYFAEIVHTLFACLYPDIKMKKILCGYCKEATYGTTKSI